MPHVSIRRAWVNKPTTKMTCERCYQTTVVYSETTALDEILAFIDLHDLCPQQSGNIVCQNAINRREQQ